MIDGKGLLDTLLGAASTGGQAGNGAGGLEDMLGQVLGGGQQGQASLSGGLGGLLGQMFGGGAAPQAQSQAGAEGGLGGLLNQVLGGMGGASSGGLIDAVKNIVAQNPTLAIGAAGLLLGTGTGRGITANAAKLGGVALVGGLAYHALKNFMAKNDATGTAAENLPEPHEYHAVATTNDGALKLVSAMIAAAMADGKIDEDEQQRILGQMGQGALSQDQIDWLNNEMAHPATPQQLAESVASPQEAAEIYTSARIVIDDDTPANKAFLVNLARALQMPAPLLAELDKAVDGVKVNANA